MGICSSQKKPSNSKSQDIASSNNVALQAVPQEKSQLRIKSESQVNMERRASRKTELDVHTPSSQKKSPLVLFKQKFNVFDLQKGFFRKYSTIKFNETEQTLICQHNLTFQLVKVTILDPRLDKCKHFWKELKQVNMNNAHICQYLETFQEKDQIYLVQEHCKGGKLSSLIENEPLPYSKAVQLIIQILNAVNHIHSLNLSHGSLTIDSFSISETKSLFLKLEDTNPIFFPESSEDAIDLERKFPTERYRAPEDEKSIQNDIWAVGIILHQLLTCEYPDHPQHEEEWKPLQKLQNVPSDGLCAIKLMLEYNPAKRTPLKQIIEKKYFKVGINEETLEQSILNLTVSKKMSQFQSAIIFFMMNNFQKEEVQILTKLFDDGDKDNDGFLNKKELENLYKILIPDNEAFINQQIEIIFQNLDVDNSGTISLDEFVTAASNKKELFTDENLESCFRILSNNNGGITAKSIARKIQINEKGLKQDIQQYVHDQISISAFKEIMRQLI